MPRPTEALGPDEVGDWGQARQLSEFDVVSYPPFPSDLVPRRTVDAAEYAMFEDHKHPFLFFC